MIIKINNDDSREIELSEYEFESLKIVMETTLKFWSNCKKDIGDFPWELFEGSTDINIMNDWDDGEKEVYLKFKELGINTYGIEEI